MSNHLVYRISQETESMYNSDENLKQEIKNLILVVVKKRWQTGTINGRGYKLHFKQNPWKIPSYFSFHKDGHELFPLSYRLVFELEYSENFDRTETDSR